MKAPRFFRFLPAMLLLLLPLLPQRAAAQVSPAGNYQFMQMTTIESIVPGGLGRSRITFTPEFKGVKDTGMENLFSVTGINLGNVRSNEEAIIRFVTQVQGDGWDLIQVTPLTQTIQGGGGSTNQGIFMTRYLFRKSK
jgi:hypothetical protein